MFGLSGVGKSTLISQARRAVTSSLHLQASALIKDGLRHPEATSESLRQRPREQVRSNQDVLVDTFWRAVRSQPEPLVIFDGHLVIDTDNGLVEIPQEVIEELRLLVMVHVEDDAAKIAERRARDRRRTRPVRSEEALDEHQQLSRRLCESYASALGATMAVCRPEELDRFKSFLTR
ncbi:AAA family ATPase [Methyloceanibacter superfactus]|uniref:AAA family ATPase n=1 Tax=Methyloceanibacter superfactus TaxID=1774969 RepID=UPI001FCD4652|nr:AAA family ATPase [Methyloceanibacter superfactus]